VDDFGYGFRVPALLVSPYARRGYVDSTTYDFTSILAFIEANWRLSPLAERDAHANNLMPAFDFSSRPRPAHIIPWERQAADVVAAPARLWVVRWTYGLAVILALGITALAALRSPFHKGAKAQGTAER
jgi:phospholipase C